MAEQNEVIFYPEIINVGGSIGVVIPKDVASTIKLEVKDRVKITLEILKKREQNGTNH